jgi:hypothetical protein
MHANDTNFQHFSFVNAPISNCSLHPTLMPHTEIFFLPVIVDLVGTYTYQAFFSGKLVATFTVCLYWTSLGWLVLHLHLQHHLSLKSCITYNLLGNEDIWMWMDMSYTCEISTHLLLVFDENKSWHCCDFIIWCYILTFIYVNFEKNNIWVFCSKLLSIQSLVNNSSYKFSALKLSFS